MAHLRDQLPARDNPAAETVLLEHAHLRQFVLVYGHLQHIPPPALPAFNHIAHAFPASLLR
jgi:hypothetical protein